MYRHNSISNDKLQICCTATFPGFMHGPISHIFHTTNECGFKAAQYHSLSMPIIIIIIVVFLPKQITHLDKEIDLFVHNHS